MGSEEEPSRRRNTPVRPQDRSGRPEHERARGLDAPEGVVVEHKDGVRVQPFYCGGATYGKESS